MGEEKRMKLAEALNKMNAPIPCPSCARFREKMDREKMAKVIGAAWYKYDEFEQMADAIIKYLTE
jgi:hypothetical protein